jgi:LPS sulfotransferase NodH
VTGNRPFNEALYEADLLSEAWDVPQATPTLLRYVVLSLQRTGSEYLCARLRRAGIGIPCEYFNEFTMRGTARRLGCLGDDGEIVLDRFLERLEHKRTTPNGVFGTKLQPLQMAEVTGKDRTRAQALVGRFDRVLTLRRRDKVAQAISLLRARMTTQWHVMPGDAPRRLELSDTVLFPMIDQVLQWIHRGEERIATAIAPLGAERVRALCCEDLTDDVTVAAMRFLAGDQPVAESDADARPGAAVPLKGDSDESRQIKARYLASSEERAVRAG